MKKIAVIILGLFSLIAGAQTLTIENGGETGTSGTNWTTTGTNPVTISATGNASINTSVIEGYLNTGVSVLVRSTDGMIAQTGDIEKTAGADATLTIRSEGSGRINNTANYISTSGKLNLVFWSDYNNTNGGGSTFNSNVSSIDTNGGHFWAGGSSSPAGTATWNGLTVGNGPSVDASSSNQNALDFHSVVLNTGGGDALFWAGNGTGAGLAGIETHTSSTISTGSGDIILISDDFDAVGALTLNTTGQLVLAPNGGSYSATITWQHGGGTNLDMSSTFDDITINNIASVSGLSLGFYDGMSGVTIDNSSNVTMASATTIAGPITVYGGNIAVNENLNTAAGTAAGDISLRGTGNIALANSKSITTNGGDVTFWADSDANGGFITINAGTTITTQGGNLVLAGGLDDGANGGVGNDGIPDGYAWRKTSDPDFGGLSIGEGTISGPALISLLSNGGDILLRGKTSDASGHPGLLTQENLVIDSGSGTISIIGTSETGNGVELGFAATTQNIAFRSASNAENAISIDGSTTASGKGGVIHLGNGSSLIQSEGTGGIRIAGTSTLHEGIVLDNMQILSANGKIDVIGTGVNGGQLLRNTDLGLRSSATAIQGITPLAVSSANIDLIANSIQFLTASNTIASTGSLNILPSGDGFTAPLTLGSLFDPASTLTGLEVGKNHNTAANVTLDKAINIAGPITVYGGEINIDANLISNATTGTGITIEGQRILQDDGIDVTTSGADISYTASAITTGSVLAITGSGVNRAIVNANGGNININASYAGTSSSGRVIAFNSADLITTGSGVISLTGDATNSSNTTISAWGMQPNDARIITDSGDITLTMTGGAASNNSRGLALDDNSMQLLSASGTITIRDLEPAGLTGVYTGLYLRPNAANTILFGANGAEVASSSSDIVIEANRATFDVQPTRFNISGTLTIRPVGAIFGTGISTANVNVESTATGITLGKPGNSSALTLARAATINGSIKVYGGDIAINENLTTTAGGADGDILLKASGNIVQAAGKSITTSGADITLWSNSDDETTNGGYIYLQDNTSLDTRTSSDRTANDGTANDTSGGAITLGGGSGTTVPTGYALNNANSFRGGINLGTESGIGARHDSNITIISGGGNISLKGRQTSVFNGDAAGINAYEGFILDAGQTGNIALEGNVSGSDASISDGMNLGNYATTAGGTASSIRTVDGDITLTGSASDATAQSRGLTLAGGGAGLFIQSTGTGNINLLGTPGGTGTQYNILLIGANILANSGDINLTGASTGKIFNANFGSTIGYKSGSEVSSSTSDITVTGDDFDLSSGFNFNTAGTLAIESFGNSFTNTFDTSQLTYSSDLTGLTIGKSTNTSTVIVGSTTSIAGPITIYGGDIAINQALTASSNNTISLNASSNVTQSAAITADNLALFGTGSFTLQNSSNNIDVLAGGDATKRLGYIAYRDADALEIGTVNPTGIFSTGTVLVETETGNLTLSESVNTTSTSDDAIILNAGRASSAGTATGGDIIVSGTPTLTTGAGGIAKLFSGSNTNSTGLTSLVGGTGSARYNLDETSNLSGENLSGNNAYAIYREEANIPPTVTSTAITSGTAQSLYYYDIKASDADNDVITWTANTVPAWLTFTSGTLQTSFVGTGATPTNTGDGVNQSPDGTSASSAVIQTGTAAHGDNKLFFTDTEEYGIRYVDANGNVQTWYQGDGTYTNLNPVGIAYDAVNDAVYVGDYAKTDILKIDNRGTRTLLSDLPEAFMRRLLVNANGTKLYASANGGIYEIDLTNSDPNTNWTRVVGTGSTGYSDTGTASTSQVNQPHGMAFDSAGRLVFTDRFNDIIRRVDLSTDTIETIAGTQGAGTEAGDGGPAVSATFSDPSGLVINGQDEIFISERLSKRIRKIDTNGDIDTFFTVSAGGFADDLVISDASELFLLTTTLIAQVATKAELTGTPTNANVGVHNVALTLSDGIDNVPYNFQITVQAINNAPTDITLDTNSINQSATGVDSTVGTLSSTDADSGNSHTYSLVAGTGDDDIASFNIDASSLRTNNALSPGSYSVRINTNDGTDDFSKAFTVTVIDDTAPDGYTVTIDQDPIDSSNQTTIGFTFAGAEIGATYNYSFSSDNGVTTVTGSGTITSATDQITAIDLSGLADGLITLIVTLTDSSANVGTPVQDSATKDIDQDNDGISDANDNCPSIANADQLDTDNDGDGDECDTDDDNDGTPDSEDDFPLNPNEDTDTDGDGTGDNTDMDDDNDGIPDSEDDFPLGEDAAIDTDGDGIRDVDDDDDDNDGIPDSEDAFPLNENEDTDTDGDGTGDNFDTDDDNDGTPDSEDDFPLDSNEDTDTDGDGIGNNADDDDDNDGIEDSEDTNPLEADDTKEEVTVEKTVIPAEALTPNGDGVNDTWVVPGIENYPFNVVRIFNRWGHQVFETVTYKNDWEGFHKGNRERLPAGPYLFIIDLGDGSASIQGWVYLNY
ncbi:gliding motility-associated C-terminal domain-containing protein [Maribacter sp. X9]|uniref:T9SS type B sorting domain-containing protein n=1 Tax=Maribacter sp. X9 TaxID=3402159 RepID=UPI003AF3ADB4